MHIIPREVIKKRIVNFFFKVISNIFLERLYIITIVITKKRCYLFLNTKCKSKLKNSVKDLKFLRLNMGDLISPPWRFKKIKRHRGDLNTTQTIVYINYHKLYIFK